LDEIRDDDVLYRRLANHQVNKDLTVNSSAFKRAGSFETAISVDLARMTDPQTSVDRAGRARFRLGRFEARHARELGFDVKHDPLPGNPAHVLIRGPNDQEIARTLARKGQGRRRDSFEGPRVELRFGVGLIRFARATRSEGADW
jgi:hypothetical protein